MAVTLPETKMQKIVEKCKTALDKKVITVQEVASLVGLLNSTAEAVLPASLYLRELQMHQIKSLISNRNYHQNIILTPVCKAEIRWWIHHLHHFNGKQIITPSPDLVIESDASNLGWGAVCNSHRMGGPLSIEEKKMHINALELKAATFAVKSMTKDKNKVLVHLKMDNVTSVAHINKMGGTRSKLLNDLTKDLWEYCLDKQITVTSEFLDSIKRQIGKAETC